MDILSILLAILIFFLIILIHEFGHFFTAKLFKMNVKEFAIGMGPKILQKERNGTTYCLKALPIGGSVMLDEDLESDDPNSFRNKPVWQRMIVIAAGAIMNFVLGFIFCVVSVLCANAVATTTVASFHDGAISSAVLQPGDKIVSINGMSIFNTMDISFQLGNSQSRGIGSQYFTYDFEVIRDGQKITLENVKFASHSYAVLISEYKKLVGESEGFAADVSAYFDIDTNKTTAEFDKLKEENPEFADKLLSHIEQYKKDYVSEKNSLFLDFRVLGEEKNFFNVLSSAGADFISDARLVWISFLNLISGTYGLNEISGPIGVIQSVSTVASFGWESLMTLAALLAVNVGIFNLLPIPAMDGARLVFLIIEAIRRKPIKAEHEGMVHFIGIVLLMLLVLVVSFNDIIRLFSGG